MEKTYYFNTGVKQWRNPYMAEGDIFINYERHIPFVCKDVPIGAVFKFGANDPNLYPESDYIVAEIISGNMQCKYAYFSKPYIPKP